MRWSTQEQAALRAAAENTILAETLLQPARRPSPRLPFFESPALIQAYQAVLRQRGAYEVIADDARRWRQFYQHTRRREPQDLWRMAFVIDMGVAWATLTGVAPTRGDSFIGFINAAFNSLLPDEADDEVAWDRAVRAVIELDLDWCQRGLSSVEIERRFSRW